MKTATRRPSSLAAAFDKTLAALRDTLRGDGLTIAGELDLASGMGKAVAGIAPTRILYVDTPLLLLRAIALERAAAVLLPFHVVVSASPGCTRIDWPGPALLEGARLPAGAGEPLSELRERIGAAVEKSILKLREAGKQDS